MINNNSSLDTKDIARKADEYMQAMVQLDKFSGAVLLAQDGQILHSAGYGLADREHRVANTSATKFRLGSITKQFTSMAVMILEEQGKLDVRDFISKHLPYSPKHWEEITIHQLLNHTSGLGNLAGIPGCRETTARLPLSVRELVETFRETPLEFRAGSQYCYSNSGYFLLGDIIECLSGISYEEFLNQYIFYPLEMADSGYDHYQTVLINRASGYCRRNDKWVRADYIDMSFPFSAGALYSTVGDLFRWDQALLSGRLISKAAHTRMTTITPLLAAYGYGFGMGIEHRRRTVSHAGGVNGFRANFVRFPEEPACIIALSNSEASDFLGVTKNLGAILFGEDYETPTVKQPVNIAEKSLAIYAGVYEIISGVTLQIEPQGRGLLVKAGKAQSHFLPESETVFFHEESGNTITFPITGDGEAPHLTLNQSEIETEARRSE